MKLFRAWLIPVLVSLAIFAVVRPTFAQIVEREVSLSEYLLDSSVSVGDDIGENGVRQVFYVYQGNKTFVTNTPYPNASPVTEKEYMAWMGQVDGSNWHIFIHHIPSGATTRLTNVGNNVNPILKDRKVAWEGWVDDSWQIYLYDGASVFQLTSGDSSLNPDIEGDNIIYARRDVAGVWRAVLYSILEKKALEVSFGENTKHPRLSGGDIILGDGGERFPLKAEDFFILDLISLETDDPKVVTEEEVLAEFEEPPATEEGETP